MSDHSELVDRLRWRERVLEDGSRTEATIDRTRESLREAASALSSQSLSLSEARERGDEYERLYRQTHLDYVAAEYKLEAAAAELSEAREEIERLKGLVAGIRETPQELADARAVITEANNSLFGSQGYFLSMNGGSADKYHLSRAIEDLKADTRLNHKMAEALRPLARLKVPWKPVGNAGAYSILFDDIRRAQSVLEICKSGLADATNDPADLSSLRKGAEVAVKPLEWDLSGMARGYPAKAVSIFGNYTAWEIEDGFWMPPEAHCGRRAGVGLQSALDAAQSDFETRIRSALVSGSREDGADA